MQQAGFAFKLANQPVEYLAASLALLTDQGLTGSDAGTALKNAFMRMISPTGEASAVMQDLGISFYDANGNMKQMPDIIGMLNTATEGLTNQQRDAALATIFLSDGMKAIIPLLDAGTEGFNKTVDTVTQVGGDQSVGRPHARVRRRAGISQRQRGDVPAGRGPALYDDARRLGAGVG